MQRNATQRGSDTKSFRELKMFPAGLASLPLRWIPASHTLSAGRERPMLLEEVFQEVGDAEAESDALGEGVVVFFGEGLL